MSKSTELPPVTLPLRFTLAEAEALVMKPPKEGDALKHFTAYAESQIMREVARMNLRGAIRDGKKRQRERAAALAAPPTSNRTACFRRSLSLLPTKTRLERTATMDDKARRYERALRRINGHIGVEPSNGTEAEIRRVVEEVLAGRDAPDLLQNLADSLTKGEAE